MEFPKRFFRRVFRSILEDRGLDVEFRCLHQSRDKDSLWPQHLWAHSQRGIEKLWPQIENLNERGYDIHLTVVPRLREANGKKEHPLPDEPMVCAIWADLDVGEGKPYKTVTDALKAVRDLKPLPSMIITSGTGIHVYYLLKKPRRVSKERFERLLLRLAVLLKGDKAAAHAKRLMRVPDTINWKLEAKRKTAKIHYLSHNGFRLRELEAVWKTSDSNSDRDEQEPKATQKDWRKGTYARLFIVHVRNLRPVGRTFETVGHCPFHEDKTPSLCVNVESGLWECKSSKCGAKGNARQFCERMDIAAPLLAPYVLENGHMCIVRQTKDGPVTTPLCNFQARIIEEVALDDGVEMTRAFVIDGKLDTGGNLPALRVPATRFSGLNWATENWGAQAIVNAGFARRDQLREAIQRLSPAPQSRKVFTHTGWREVGGKSVFLTGSGAIGQAEAEVDVGRDLQRYCLPLRPTNPREAMKASLGLLNLAPLAVTLPLWATMYRAPLAAALPVDFSVFLEGQTGSFKSTLAALFLSHFGEFDTKSLPGSWESTANQLEHRAFILKDLPFVIDDYSPKPMGYREMEAKAARLLRAQGNLSGRGRLRDDITERPAHPPRGIIVSTGEQHPPGQSLVARILLLRLEKKIMNVSALSAAQSESDRLPHALSGYINWLAPWVRCSEPILLQLFRHMRSQAKADGHRRIPEILAHLYIGLFFGTWYAETVGACSHIEAVELRGKGWCALLNLGDTQVRAVESERPTRRFFQVIFTLLSQSRAKLLPRSNVRPPEKETIGWYDDNLIYLMPEAAYETVSRFCRDCGETFVLRPERLRRELHDEGLLSGRDSEHLTVNKFLGGKQRRVLSLYRTKVEELIGEHLPYDEIDESGEEDTTGLTGTGGYRGRKDTPVGVAQILVAADDGAPYHNKPVKPAIRRFPRLPLRFPRLPEASLLKLV